jgi:hypothetical protein
VRRCVARARLSATLHPHFQDTFDREAHVHFILASALRPHPGICGMIHALQCSDGSMLGVFPALDGQWSSSEFVVW